MKILKLQNFRCYEDTEITFKPGINLLVGDNASGKTSILKACKYVLSSFFAGFNDENTTWENFKNDDFRQVSSNGETLPLKPIEISFSNDGSLFQYDLEDFNGTDEMVTMITPMQSLVQTTKKSSKIGLTGIKGYRNQSTDLLKTYYENDMRVKPLPLFAYFAAKDYENTTALIKKRFKQYNHIPSFGYFECLDIKSNFKNWINRLLILAEGGKNLQDINIVMSAIVDALGVEGCNIISSMDVRHKQGKVYYILTDEREIDSDSLSDGYKRIVNIVTDLAFRCVHLNRGMYDMNCCKKTGGTVLIDEIDLHLHPILQSTVLKGLRNAFPKLQFIVSSHAPMVMSSVESNEENVVYKLDYINEEGYSVNEVVTYGMDLSTISKVILDQTPRDKGVAEDLKKLFHLIDNDQNEPARILLAELRGKYTIELPDFVEAEAMLNFTIFDDEADN